MVNSMTAFASLGGEHEGTRWILEIRSVNGRGLDIRTRFPEGCEPLEAVVKKAVGDRCKRGNVSFNIKLQREHEVGLPALNIQALEAAVWAAKQAVAVARAENLDIAPVQTSELLGLNGVFAARSEKDRYELNCLPQMTTDIAEVVASFAEARAEEGAALLAILTRQIDQIEDLCTQAGAVLEARQEKSSEVFRTNVAKIILNSEGIDEARLVQELALLAVKSDVTEELDRLTAHVAAARQLLAEDGAIGRKFDFLTQEFNREANTLCSKANYTDLTRIGLDLKTVIDQMREQVQNVE